MITRFYFIIIPLLFLLSVGCESVLIPQNTYFGGQIKNPKDNTVFIYKNDTQIAKTKLNKANHFLFKLDSLQAGLYTFKHGEEFQYLYLEPKDSLLIRLNTWDFDESLIFSGKGATRNNFLIQLFLDNEKDEKSFYQFFHLDEATFLEKADSLTQLKTIRYQQFKEGASKQSKQFDALIQTAIYLPIYANKEKYAPHHQHLKKFKKLPILSPHFYNHRNTFDLNSNAFNNYYAYRNYLWNKLYNISLYKSETDSVHQFATVLLKEIATSTQNKALKNIMLQRTYTSILFDDSCKKIDLNLAEDLFFKNCTDEKCKKEMKLLADNFKSLKKNTKLPSFDLLSSTEQKINVQDLITQNTVLYYWPKEQSRIKNMAKRITYLKTTHPNIKFIGITKGMSNTAWYETMHRNKLSPKSQFKLTDSMENPYSNNQIPRAIIVDKQGVIQCDFTFLSHPDFEKKLFPQPKTL